MMKPRTCVSPEGKFIVGIHKPWFDVKNLRQQSFPEPLGKTDKGIQVDNQVNFPESDVHEPHADLIYEIANPFPFRGATFINSAWADRRAGKPQAIGLPDPPACSFSNTMEKIMARSGPPLTPKDRVEMIGSLPKALRLALAQSSTDPEDLMALAASSCTILFEKDSGMPWGMGFKELSDGSTVADIKDHDVFEVLVNNRFLPDSYKNALVLKPGVQGKSEIIGEYLSENGNTHVFEYLRRNSYIPWGHFASNMANDAIRYQARDLTLEDMTGIRHLYYQRIYVRTAAQLDILPDLSGDFPKKCMTGQKLEELRQAILRALKENREKNPEKKLDFTASLWGWNFGFGSAQSGHRLHASHQMIHQQNAMVPGKIRDRSGTLYDCFSCGDMVTDFIKEFYHIHGTHFFDAYLTAIFTNERTDQNSKGESSLIVHEDENIILFVPKAQVSEWELNLIARKKIGNILEADSGMRKSLDHGILKAVQVLEQLGAEMVTGIELSGRFDRPDLHQHLLYSFIPRLPYAPGTFSEAQLRWISGCYPEDFANACRKVASPKKEGQ